MRLLLCVSLGALLVAGSAGADELATFEVTAAWPGHSAAELEAAVATPLEHTLAASRGIEDLTSESRAEVTTVRVALPSAGGAEAVQRAVRAAGTSLPVDLPTPPTYREAPADGAGIRFVISVPMLDAGALQRLLADDIGNRLAELPGTARVSVCGGGEVETEARLAPAMLNAAGVTVADVVAALRKGPAASLSQTVIATRNRVPIRLADVARVAVAPHVRCYAWRGEGRVGFGEVLLRRHADAEARARVVARLVSIAAELPPGASLAVLAAPHPAELTLTLGGDSSEARATQIAAQLAHSLGVGGVVRWNRARPDRIEATAEAPVESVLRATALPGVSVEVRGADVPDALEVEVTSASRDGLAAAAEALGRVAATSGEIAGYGVEGDEREPRLELAVDETQRARLGIRAEDVKTTFAVARDGLRVGGVVVRLDGPPAEILQLAVPAEQGQRVALAALGALRQTLAPAVLRHAGQFPEVTLRLRPRRPLSLVEAVILVLRLDAAAPPQVRFRFRA